MSSEKRVQWGDHPRQNFEIFEYDEANIETIIFIHGGAWTIEEEKPVDFLDFGTGLSLSGYNMFSVDYRLSPGVKDPLHLLDVLHSIQIILEKYKVKRIHFAGHSVGAFMCLQLQDYGNIISSGLSELIKKGIITDTEEEEHQIFLKQLKTAWEEVEIINVFYLSGVYHLPKGLEEDAKEYSFVLEAFVAESHYTNASQASSKILSEPFHQLKIKGKHVILHSFHDEYVTSKQLLSFCDWLYVIKIPYELYVEDFGDHAGSLHDEKSKHIVKRIILESSLE